MTLRKTSTSIDIVSWANLWCQVRGVWRRPPLVAVTSEPFNPEAWFPSWKWGHWQGCREDEVKWEGENLGSWGPAHKRWWRWWWWWWRRLWLLLPLTSASGLVLSLLWGRAALHSLYIPALVRPSFSGLAAAWPTSKCICVSRSVYFPDPCCHSPTSPIFKFKVILGSWNIPKCVFGIFRVVTNNSRFRICLMKPSNNT